MFYADVVENGTVTISTNSNLPETAVDEFNYLLYTLTVTFTNTSLDYYTIKENTTILIELHP